MTACVAECFRWSPCHITFRSVSWVRFPHRIIIYEIVKYFLCVPVFIVFVNYVFVNPSAIQDITTEWEESLKNKFEDKTTD